VSAKQCFSPISNPRDELVKEKDHRDSPSDQDADPEYDQPSWRDSYTGKVEIAKGNPSANVNETGTIEH